MSMTDPRELTDNEIKRTERLLREWHGVAARTGPVSHLMVEKGIRYLYRDAGFQAPARICWCRSPVSMLLADRLLALPTPTSRSSKPRLDDLVARLVATLPTSVAERVQQDINEVTTTDPGACLQDQLVDEPFFDVNVVLRNVDRDRFDAVKVKMMQSHLLGAVNGVRNAIVHALDSWVLNATHPFGTNEHFPVATEPNGFTRPYLPKRLDDRVAFGGRMILLAARMDTVREVLGRAQEVEPLHQFIELAQHCHGIIAYQNTCLVLERPSTLHRDDDDLLHHSTEAAIAYPDGWGVYAVHGTVVPPHVVAEPERIDFADIDREENEAVREVLLNAYGLQRYLEAVEPQTLASDAFGALLCRRFRGGGDPLVVVRVVNATPETNGSYRHYYLRVPPHVESPREAVAWTFGLEEHEYAPIEES